MISFTNECLTVSENKATIPPSDIVVAELKYSQYRYEALLDEWRIAYPSLHLAMELLRSRENAFQLSDLPDAAIDNVSLEIVSARTTTRNPLTKAASTLVDDPCPKNRNIFRTVLASILYRVGAIGLKLSPQEPAIYAHMGRPVVTAAEIGGDTGIRVVKMLHAYLRIHEKGRKQPKGQSVQA